MSKPSYSLDLNASRWNLSEDTVRMRRRICQSMFFLDTFIVRISIHRFLTSSRKYMLNGILQ
jgi:hypothetical protein